jgi:hypothetical protein
MLQCSKTALPSCFLGRFLPKLGGAAKRRHFFAGDESPMLRLRTHRPQRSCQATASN